MDKLKTRLDDQEIPAEETPAAADTAVAADDGPDAKTEDGDDASTPATPERRINWARVLVYTVMPGLAMVLAITAGFLKWQDSSVRQSELAGIESLQAAKDSTVALLSYKPDTVERELTAARERLTGNFRDSYVQLTDDVVIPGSKQQQIAAAASVAAAAAVSANPKLAVVLVFVNQTVTIGKENPPTARLACG